MHDIRLAVRGLRATPIVSIVAILSLALGIGANTAIFSIVDSLLLRALPVQEPQRLVLLTAGSDTYSSWTNPSWEQIRDRRTELFDNAFAWSTDRYNLAQGGEAHMINGIIASGGFFTVLGVPAILGRTFTEADDRRGGGPDGPVAVISYGFWQRQFGGAADAIGRSISLGASAPFTIVGVTPPDFSGPDVGRSFDVVVPLGTEPLFRGAGSMLDERSSWWISVMARLRPGQSIAAATAALRGVQPQVREATLPQDWRPQDLKEYLNTPFSLLPAGTGSSGLRTRYQRPLLTIMAVVGLVLLIACANIANLLLARAAARRHELSVRLALGASQWHLARQLLTESVVLAAAGAGLGFVFAQWGSRLLVQQLSTQVNTVFLDLAPDWRVLLFTAGVATATALLFGTAPALRATRVEPIEALKEQGRGASGERRTALASSLVVAQVALSLMLLVGAGLFVRTFASLATLNLGLESDRVLVVNISAPPARFADEDTGALFERVRLAVSRVSGVERAATSDVALLNGAWQTRVHVEGGAELPEQRRGVNANAVSPGWFATYGTPILAGRDFTERDVAGASEVAIVNQAFARRFLNGANPIGRRLLRNGGLKPPPPLEVVGLAADAVYRSLRDPVPPTLYVAVAQRPTEVFRGSAIVLSVRASGGAPALLTKSVAAAIGEVNRGLVLTFRPLSDQVNGALIQERLVAILSSFFGGLALLLAGLGLYGVTSYAVSRRRTEIGIRMALGAAPAGVVRLILVRVAALVGGGVVLGALASLWAARFVETLLFGLKPRDTVTLVGAIVVLVAVGALAGWIPAFRASRIDPARVLRDS